MNISDVSQRCGAQTVKVYLDEEVGCFSTTPKGIAITLVNLCQFIKGPAVIILDFSFSKKK